MGVECVGEPLNLWLQQASVIRHAVGVHDLLSEQDFRKFVRGVFELSRSEAHVQHTESPARFHTTSFSDVLFDHLSGRRTPVIDDRYTRQFVEMQLGLHVNTWLSASVDIQVWPDRQGHFIVVRNLLGAIYLSLANEVTGASSAPRRCLDPECRQTIKRQVRSDIKFCSSRCRQRNYRRRRAKRKAP